MGGEKRAQWKVDLLFHCNNSFPIWPQPPRTAAFSHGWKSRLNWKARQPNPLPPKHLLRTWWTTSDVGTTTTAPASKRPCHYCPSSLVRHTMLDWTWVQSWCNYADVKPHPEGGETWVGWEKSSYTISQTPGDRHVPNIGRTLCQCSSIATRGGIAGVASCKHPLLFAIRAIQSWCSHNAVQGKVANIPWPWGGLCDSPANAGCTTHSVGTAASVLEG